MSGQANLFSRFGFQVGPDGKIDTYTRAFFSKFKGRVGPAIPDLATDASWAETAVTINALIKEFVAQGWIQKGFLITQLPQPDRWFGTKREHTDLQRGSSWRATKFNFRKA